MAFNPSINFVSLRFFNNAKPVKRWICRFVVFNSANLDWLAGAVLMTLTQLIAQSDMPLLAMAKRIGVTFNQIKARATGDKRALTLTQQEQLRALLIDDDTDDNDGMDWETLANKYEEPAPKGAEYWGMGSFYKLARGRVWVFIDNEWIKSSKTEQAVKGYTRVKESNQ